LALGIFKRKIVSPPSPKLKNPGEKTMKEQTINKKNL
jgi:hypothetical protein